MSTYHCDGSITDEVHQALAALPEARRVAVSVHDGRVVLRGTVADSGSRRTIKDQIAMIDGVSSITDLLTVVQPAAAPLAPALVTTNGGPQPSQARR